MSEAEDRSAYAWFTTVDHKKIGVMYLLTAAIFFVIGGVEALVIRLQLVRPNNDLITALRFNQLFTMHGTTMIFLVVMPTLVGFANYFVPLQIGARDMAFPRLNALSFWLFPLGGFLLHFAMLAGGTASAGWFSYAPLAERPYSSDLGTDYWILSLLVLGTGSVATAINLIATVLSLRAPGMKLTRVPLFTWMTFITQILVVLAVPVLNAAIVMLLIDRRLDAHFFLPSGGGNAILWQHFFWTFGHPEVYILALPAFGMISEIIPVFSRKPIFGYEFVAASSVAIAILSFGVWAHHMFAAGLGHNADIVFSASSMLIAIPTGVKIFNWIATMWGGSIRFNTSMMFATAFLLEFVIGGLSGITFAVAPIDWQMTDTYYVVAHFHYVMFGGTAFAIMAGTYYWFPKMSGRMLSERLGKWHFWLMVLGFNTTFMVQHFLGMLGMPRRIFTYPDLPYWGLLNMISTVGAVMMGLASLLFMINIAKSLRSGEPAGDNPWKGWTLEWATPSPPPHDNFSEGVPPVFGRRPLWDLEHDAASGESKKTESKKSESKKSESKKHDATKGDEKSSTEETTFEEGRVAVWAFIVSESAFFLILIIAYVFYNAYAQQGGPTAATVLDVKKTGTFTACLFSSSFTLWLSERSQEKQQHAASVRWLCVTIALGTVFMVGQGLEYVELFRRGMTASTNLFSTTFFTLTGFHGLHVTAGLLMLGVVLGRAIAGDFKKGHSPLLKNIGLYWHFVDVVWLAVFVIVYVKGAR